MKLKGKSIEYNTLSSELFGGVLSVVLTKEVAAVVKEPQN